MTDRTYRLRGDWMRNGYIDNLDRQSYFEVVIVDGKAYDRDLFGLPDNAGRVEVDADDCLRAWGESTAFCPDKGEIDRIGRNVFKSAE